MAKQQQGAADCTVAPTLNAGYLRIKLQQKNIGLISKTCLHSFIMLSIDQTHSTKEAEKEEKYKHLH